MLNGKFEIHTFENISQNAYSKDDDISLKSKEEQFLHNLDESFVIGARLSN